MSDKEELEMSLPEAEDESMSDSAEVSLEEPEPVAEKKKPAVKSRAKKAKRKPSATKAPASARPVRSIYPGVIVVSTGMPSKASYRWSEIGAVVQVAEEDVDVVMAKNGSGARECCGSSSLPVYFEFAD
jgi:cytoskeletal protein RodZ